MATLTIFPNTNNKNAASQSLSADGILACFLQRAGKQIEYTGTISNITLDKNRPLGTRNYKSIARIFLSFCLQPDIVQKVGSAVSLASATLTLPDRDGRNKQVEFSKETSGFFLLLDSDIAGGRRVVAMNEISESDLYVLALSFVFGNPEADLLALLNDNEQMPWGAVVMYVFSNLANIDPQMAASMKQLLLYHHGQETFDEVSRVFASIADMAKDLQVAEEDESVAIQLPLPEEKTFGEDQSQVLLDRMFLTGDTVIHCKVKKSTPD